MTVVDFVTGLPRWLSIFVGAFSYPLVALIFVLCAITGGLALMIALSRDNHDNRKSKRLVMGCIAVMAITVALGMWSFSDQKAEQDRFLHSPSTLSF